MFYSNRDNLKDIRKHGNTSILSQETLNLLKEFPPLSTFYEIESDMLARGEVKYGPQFIYAFMEPAENKYAAGVFDGHPIPEPYSPTGRYARGLQFLSDVSRKNLVYFIQRL